jgi:hypothetical protein
MASRRRSDFAALVTRKVIPIFGNYTVLQYYVITVRVAYVL